MRWRVTRDRKGPLVEWREKLPSGKVFRFAFSINTWNPDEAIIMPHLIVHRPFLRGLTWRFKAGRPTGDSGLSTWVKVFSIWESGLAKALSLTDRRYVEVQVEAESPELLSIYANRLQRHGYELGRFNDEPYLWKTLRGS